MNSSNVCGRVPWLYQYWPGGFMVFVVLCPGTPEGSTGSCSGFKTSQKTGQRLKVSSDRLKEAGNRFATPGLQDIGLSPTPRRLLYLNSSLRPIGKAKSIDHVLIEKADVNYNYIGMSLEKNLRVRV